MHDKKEMGKRLRRIREQLGMDREQFAKAVGVKPRTIQQVELGYQRLGKASWTIAERLLNPDAGNSVGPTGDIGPSKDGELVAKIVSYATDQQLLMRAESIAKILECSLEEAMTIVIKRELHK